MILAQAFVEYGLAAMMSAIRTTAANFEYEVRQNPTVLLVGVGIMVLIWWLFLKRY